jgi:hypothetical protein
MDRGILLELREFLTIAVEWFRWLLSAIDQNVVDMSRFYLEWREHRVLLRPDLVGSSLRRYYLGKDFRPDFLHFVGGHAVSKEHMTASLLAAEEALLRSTPAPIESAEQISPDQPLKWSDVPSKGSLTDVIELQWSLQKIVEALSSKAELSLDPDRSFYAIRESPDGDRTLTKVSNWLAFLIRACDGTRTIQEIVTQLSLDIPEVKEEVKSYVFVRLLQGAQTQGFVTIHRTNRPESGPDKTTGRIFQASNGVPLHQLE